MTGIILLLDLRSQPSPNNQKNLIYLKEFDQFIRYPTAQGNIRKSFIGAFTRNEIFMKMLLFQGKKACILFMLLND